MKNSQSNGWAFVGIFAIGMLANSIVSANLVPRATAAPGPQIWEYKCDHSSNMEKLLSRVAGYGQEGWEMSGSLGVSAPLIDQQSDKQATETQFAFCFKRPKTAYHAQPR